MSLTEVAIAQRQEAIIKYTEVPRTVQQVADHIGVSYHTARNDLISLVRNDAVRIAAQTSEHGKRMFVAGGKRPIPMVYVKGHARPLTDFLEPFVERPEMRVAKEAAYTIFQVNMELMHAACGDSVDEPTLAQWRKALMNAVESLNITITIADTMLKSYALWNGDSLLRVKNDEAFDIDTVKNLYVRYLDNAAERIKKEKDEATESAFERQEERSS